MCQRAKWTIEDTIIQNLHSSSLQTIITWHAVTLFTSTNHSDWGRLNNVLASRCIIHDKYQIHAQSSVASGWAERENEPVFLIFTHQPPPFVKTLHKVLGYLSNSTTKPPLPPSDNTYPTHNRHDIQAQRDDDYAKRLTLKVMEEMKVVVCLSNYEDVCLVQDKKIMSSLDVFWCRSVSSMHHGSLLLGYLRWDIIRVSRSWIPRHDREDIPMAK